MNLQSFILVLFQLSLYMDLTISIKIHKVKVYAKEHKPLKLHCQNVTQGKFVSVVWLTNAYSRAKYTAFSYDVNHKTTIHSNFANRVTRVNGTSIIIKNARLEDSGDWECNIIYLYRPKGTVEESRRRVSVLAIYDVMVVSPPSIRKVYPELVAAPQNYRKTAVCQAFSANPFSLAWIKINDAMTKYVTFQNTEYRVNNEYRWTSHIFFDNLTEADTGRYLCVAKNIAGQVSRAVDVHLQAKPRMVIEKTTFRANLNEDGEIKCVASGYPKVSFTWVFTYNYEQITLKSNQRNGNFKVSKTRYTYVDRRELSTSVLRIKNVDPKHWVSYKCIAENSIGYDYKRYLLGGYGIPDAPALLNTEDISANRLTLHWLLDKSNGVTKSVVLERRQSGQKEWDGVEIHKAVTKYTFVDLKEKTYYEFRLKARNNVGLSVYSEILKLRTSELIVAENKGTSPPPASKKIFLNLDLISLTAICGAVILLLTCMIATLCVIVQDRRYRKRKKEKKKSEKNNLISLQHGTQVCQL